MEPGKKSLYNARIQKFQSVVLLAVVVFNLQLLFVEKSILVWVYCISIGVLTMADWGVRHRIKGLFANFWGRWIYTAQAVLSVIYGIYVGGEYGFAFGVLCFVIFAMEAFFSTELTDSFERKTIFIILFFPSAFIISMYVLGLDNSNIANIVYSYMVIFVLLVYFFLTIIEIAERLIRTSQIELFRGARAIEEARAESQKVLEHQHKIEETNQLLGRQKIELQAINNKLNQAYSEMSLQNEIMTHISSELEIDKLLPIIAQNVAERLELDIVVMALRDSPLTANLEGKRYYISSTLNDFFGEYIGGYIEGNRFDSYMASNQIFTDDNIETGKYDFNPMDVLSSVIMVPFVKEEVQVGYLFAGSKKAAEFSSNKDFFETISKQVLVAITNAGLYSKMEQMAVRDGLTNIYNRRHLTERLTKKLEAARQENKPVSVALFDIDKFKNVNDTYGHLCGDEVIKRAASLARKHAKMHGGFAGRYGGEEFVMVFPDIDVEEAYEYLKVFHEDVREQVVEFDGREIVFRVSVGLTCYPSTCDNIQDILSRADWSMYYSKQHGRDQITVDSEEVRTEAMNS